MENKTITETAKLFGLSQRTLRYYESIGLLSSIKNESNAYRSYDDAALLRIRQILLLKKLRIPLSEIRKILEERDTAFALSSFQKKAEEIDYEIESFSSIREVLTRLIQRIKVNYMVPLSIERITDEELFSLIYPERDSFDYKLKEKDAMNNLEQINHPPALTDVRILYLPPSSVASAHFVGDLPEDKVSEMIDSFVLESNLTKIHPALRLYGFNNPNPVDETNYHGYEMWVTIPDDMEVPAPLEKKQFAGGLYAAHMIKLGDFNEWDWLLGWVTNSETYEFAGDMNDSAHMFGLLEEHLNYRNDVLNKQIAPEGIQLDLLVPVREKEKSV